MDKLKSAEQKASQLVQDARKARTDRMKEAKSEAEQIVSAFKAEQEAAYQDNLAKSNGKTGQSGNELQSNTNNDISSLSREFAQRKDAVEQKLLDLVIHVEIKAPSKVSS